MKTGNWKGGGDEKRFGNKVRKWFARRLQAELEGVRFYYQLTDSELNALADRFISESERHVIWEDADDFHGARFANGSWSVDWKKLTGEIRELLREIRSDTARGAVPTLEDWLRGDLNDTLAYSVTGGSDRLPEKMRQRLTEAARARRRGWPLGCADCGGTFYRHAKQRGKPLRCPDCLLRRKWRGEGPVR